MPTVGNDYVLEARGVRFRHHGNDRDTLAEVSFQIPRGQSTAVVGLSGRGKSTLLRLISGLTRPTEGVVLFNGEQIDGPPRGLGIVFQNYRETVFDWLTVAQNIALAAGKPSARSTKRRIVELSRRLQISHLLRETPKKLSGGELQRVAIARGLLQKADVLLLDEPFSSLDTVARHELIATLSELNREFGTTFVIVSHDIEEALLATTRLYCLLHFDEIPQFVEMRWGIDEQPEGGEAARIFLIIRQRADRIMEVLRLDRDRVL